ncbi:hypothetical protein ASU31_20860 [Pedobacter ginsenosidimutans]|uniref:Uncharacterized protein n=1 Tax=Pedobacter ginsenosidimutans TaxID=687842 RepID=A0A0T5VJS6_9SPHI|nr:hypothetical protein ASU31_20860 [Pedobacter ginsenosidimutans]
MLFKVIFNLENIYSKHYDLKSRYSGFSITVDLLSPLLRVRSNQVYFIRDSSAFKNLLVRIIKIE